MENYIRSKISPGLKKNLLFRKVATEIGDYLLENKTEFWGGINWISKVADTNGKYHISVLNYDLYDGQAGVALFFLYLYKKNRKSKYLDVFIQIYEQLGEELRNKYNFVKNDPSRSSFEIYPASAFSHPASFLYLTAHALSESRIEVSEKNIEILLEIIEAKIKQTQVVDYLLGLSGILDLLMNVRKDFESFPVFLNTIERLIELAYKRLIDKAVVSKDFAKWKYFDHDGTHKYLGGYAHGATSIAHTLFKYSHLYNDKNAHNFAKKTLDFDRTFFSKEELCWHDKREMNSKGDSKAWCHGSAGIGFGRVLSSKYFKDDFIKDEISIALKNTLEDGFHGNQSVCHGDFGNLEIIKVLAYHTHADTEKIEDFVNEVITSICEDYLNGKKFYYGDASGDELIGLYLGLAGIGYQLLRFYDWSHVPSILCLETPNSMRNELH